MNENLRARVRSLYLADEANLLRDLAAAARLSPVERAEISDRAAELVRRIRASAQPGLMEVFLAEYGLSTEEGIALMCLAEALLRVPDAATIDALIEDKITPSDWARHLGHSASPLVNASTWALLLTGRVLDETGEGVAKPLRAAVKRLGEPVIRAAARAAMKEMGRQFVLGETIEDAVRRARAAEAEGYTHSYDMLGEAARTDADARRYHLAYSKAIGAIAAVGEGKDIRDRPGISVKLSALFPRYERAQRDRVMSELVARTRALALLARSAGIGFNIDAEEADRLDLSLDVIEAVAADPALAGWDGFGVVVQAYGRRASAVIDWLYDLATRLDRRFMVRLVKGAYWDTEIKRAQVLGLEDFPVFTRKEATDVSYIANARKLLEFADRLYPQFATHNAHTVAAILHMAGPRRDFEFQRLHGMGERLHRIVHEEHGTRCRIYAPVGRHRDLLAYLVRRLLENGANSSFVHQIVNEEVPPEEIARDPFTRIEALMPNVANPVIRPGPRLFPNRKNSRGWDLSDETHLRLIEEARGPALAERFRASPILASGVALDASPVPVTNPARPADIVGHVTNAGPEEVAAAIAAARPWDAPAEERSRVLGRAAELYEAHFGRIFALLAREAGKTLLDSVAELREAVDFLHYYRAEAQALKGAPRGVIACISPWNFPLAIFTGQIAAALATGNAVLAKPAEQTPLIAHLAVSLLLEAGVPPTALQLLPGDGPTVGAALAADPRVAGVTFTGSTETAAAINRAMAANLSPGARLVAETGGLNAMIVDSTALPEQAVRDIVTSAFQSAGQRCSALRCLYLQEEIADEVLTMLFGAMDELRVGDPWKLSTDVGPVIDDEAKGQIARHIEKARQEGRVLKALPAPAEGIFIGPTVIEVPGIEALEREVFGPVLHVARFRADRIDKVLEAINATGYGLTFGLHSRIDDRVQTVVERLHVGNIYVNRNQIGAVVGSQPFGGEGLSGTGPKAGGPHYLPAFIRPPAAPEATDDGQLTPADEAARALQAARGGASAPAVPIAEVEMPGPTGESNRLFLFPRAPILCLGPGRAAAARQRALVEAAGGVGVEAPGLDPVTLRELAPLGGVLFWGDEGAARDISRALAARSGPIVPLIVDAGPPERFLLERHLCIDTTAAGGNAALLAQSAAT